MKFLESENDFPELVKVSPKTRERGLFRGQVKELDPDWWNPMADEEVDAFIVVTFSGLL